MKTLTLFYVSLIFLAAGCYEPHDSRVHLRQGIRSDSLENNIVTRPVAGAFSALIGEGIEITNAFTNRNNDAGLLQLHVSGYNRSYGTKRFRYRVEWIDENGIVIETKTSVWLPASAMGKSPFGLKAVAPRPEAVDFRMDTRKWE